MGRGGYHERLRIGGSCKTAKKAAPGSIAAHPFGKLRAGSCKKRKDGHPPFEGRATRRTIRTRNLFAPIVVRRSNGLELDGNHLSSGDQILRLGGIARSAGF